MNCTYLVIDGSIHQNALDVAHLFALYSAMQQVGSQRRALATRSEVISVLLILIWSPLPLLFFWLIAWARP